MQPTVTLVRHGQAQLFSTNYDQLSDLGIAQCQKLGEFWQTQGKRFDAVFSGPARRHRHSAELIAAALDLPKFEVIPGFDELPFGQVARQGIPHVIGNQPHLASAAEQLATPNPDNKIEQFQSLFLACLGAWVDETVEFVETESFQSFLSRTRAALQQVVQTNYSSVLVVTSAGPIASATTSVLAAPDAAVYSLIWQSRNSSFTELVEGPRGLTISEFNATPHLTEQSWMTYF
jgi:broad specificity phosphatase PhoE